MTMTWKLQAISGELEGQEVTIDRDMLVGRHQDADIQLQSAEISRRHAAFLLKENALWVQDLKSSNGTFVNDIRVSEDKMLKGGDIVQFASVRFSVLAPAKSLDSVAEPVNFEAVQTAEKAIQQPSEAIATAEIQQASVEVEKTTAEQMNEQGMPELSERDANVQLTREGMPSDVAIPKPAPIPEGLDIHASVKNEAFDVKIPEVCAQEEAETQKNAKTGLITIVAFVILAIVAWLFFK